MIDYYAELQVHPAAEKEVIEKAYKALIFKYHPDRGGSEEKAKRITAAYYVLSDMTRRREYDAQLRASKQAEARRAAASVSTTPSTATEVEYTRPRDIPPEVLDAIIAYYFIGAAAATARTAGRVIGAVAADAVAAADRALVERRNERERTAREEQAKLEAAHRVDAITRESTHQAAFRDRVARTFCTIEWRDATGRHSMCVYRSGEGVFRNSDDWRSQLSWHEIKQMDESGQVAWRSPEHRHTFYDAWRLEVQDESRGVLAFRLTAAFTLFAIVVNILFALVANVIG